MTYFLSGQTGMTVAHVAQRVSVAAADRRVTRSRHTHSTTGIVQQQILVGLETSLGRWCGGARPVDGWLPLTAWQGVLPDSLTSQGEMFRTVLPR